MLKYILFDFDGTLVNSEKVSIAIYNELAQKYHTKKISDIEKLRGMSIREVIHELQIPLLEIPFLVHDFKKKVHENIEGIQLVPGITKVLATLHTMYPLAILSSNKASTINSFLERAKIVQLFSFVQGDCSVLGKHRSLKRFIHDQKLSTEDVVYIGDELRDIIAAKKAHMPIISVSWGYNSRSLLGTANPDYLIDKPRDLVLTIKNIKKHFI